MKKKLFPDISRGFKQYRGLIDAVYVDGEVIEKKEVAPSVADTILDKIFALDENGWPSSSYSIMLSSKTSDDIRKYIEDHILVADTAERHVIDNKDVISKFTDLPTDFLAKTSRNRYETLDQYEDRISSYINSLREDDARMARKAKFEKALNDATK